MKKTYDFSFAHGILGT